MSEQIHLPSCIDNLGVEDRFFVVNTLRSFCNSACQKYVAGQKEHGGSILDRPVIGEAMLECIDMMFYLQAAHQKYVTASVELIKERNTLFQENIELKQKLQIHRLV